MNDEDGYETLLHDNEVLPNDDTPTEFLNSSAVPALEDYAQHDLFDYSWISNAQKSFWKSQVNIEGKRTKRKRYKEIEEKEVEQRKKRKLVPPKIGEEWEIFWDEDCTCNSPGLFHFDYSSSFPVDPPSCKCPVWHLGAVIEKEADGFLMKFFNDGDVEIVPWATTNNSHWRLPQ